MTRPARAPVAHGWTLLAHPAFLDQLEALIAAAETRRRADSSGYGRSNAAKRLAAVVRLAFEIIPQDPARAEFRLGTTLGASRKHWFRAKFLQQYRLFFRFSTTHRMIIYGWINDDDTRRAYGSPDDAYLTFGKMLNRGRPPDDWDALERESRAASARLAAMPREPS